MRSPIRGVMFALAIEAVVAAVGWYVLTHIL